MLYTLLCLLFFVKFGKIKNAGKRGVRAVFRGFKAVITTGRFVMDDGNTKTIFLNSLSTKEILSQITPKQKIQSHYHDCVEVFYVISGSAEHNLNNAAINVSAGDAFMLFPQDKHLFVAQSDDFLHRDVLINLEYFKAVCAVYDAKLYDFLKDKPVRRIAFSVEQINAFEQLLVQTPARSRAEQRRFECVIVTTLLNEFLKQNKKKNSPSWVEKLAKHLSSPEEFNQSISEIVSHYPYSVSYICRIFKKHYGVPINNFFNARKIEYAQILLLTTDYTIEQICEIVGFNSVSYF